MKIILEQLYKGIDCFEYSNLVEEKVGRTVSGPLGVIFHKQTEGYNPYYDFVFNQTKVELKITSKAQPRIEFATYNFKKSGIMLTEAEYYLMICPGGSRKKFVGKVRLFEVDELKQKVAESIKANNYQKIEPADRSPGSLCVEVDAKKLEKEYWLGDCDLIFQNGRVIGFDIGTFIPTNAFNCSFLFN